MRSKAIYRTNDADLIACMQAEVMSTRVQKLPQLRPLAEITWSTENVLFVPNWKEPCVRKFEGLARSEIFRISQTIWFLPWSFADSSYNNNNFQFEVSLVSNQIQ